MLQVPPNSPYYYRINIPVTTQSALRRRQSVLESQYFVRYSGKSPPVMESEQTREIATCSSVSIKSNPIHTLASYWLLLTCIGKGFVLIYTV